MRKYEDKSGNSGVELYEIEKHQITIKFKERTEYYVYTIKALVLKT